MGTPRASEIFERAERDGVTLKLSSLEIYPFVNPDLTAIWSIVMFCCKGSVKNNLGI